MEDIMLMIIEPDVTTASGVHSVKKLGENIAHATYFSYLEMILPKHLQKCLCVEESYTTAMQFAFAGNIYYSGMIFQIKVNKQKYFYQKN